MDMLLGGNKKKKLGSKKNLENRESKKMRYKKERKT